MSTEVTITEENSDAPKQGRGPAWALWLLALLALLAVAISLLSWYQVREIRMNSSALSSSLLPVETDIQGLSAGLAESKRATAGLAADIGTLKQQQISMEDDLQALFRQRDKGNNDWTLAEIEHLLIVATHRLALEKDVPMALAAMEAADDRIKNNTDPGLLVVRRQVTADINSLKAVPSLDISGLSLYLSDLVTRVVDLPLQEVQLQITAQPGVPVQEQDSSWKKMVSAIWRELKSLVQISRQGEESLATLLPEQRYFLFQNLRLQLESARYAVLRRDTQNLHMSVEIIMSWLKDYFDTSDAGVDSILESLEQMSSLELDPALPDISSSLESVRAYIKAPGAPMEEEATDLQGPR